LPRIRWIFFFGTWCFLLNCKNGQLSPFGKHHCNLFFFPFFSKSQNVPPDVLLLRPFKRLADPFQMLPLGLASECCPEGNAAGEPPCPLFFFYLWVKVKNPESDFSLMNFRASVFFCLCRASPFFPCQASAAFLRQSDLQDFPSLWRPFSGDRSENAFLPPFFRERGTLVLFFLFPPPFWFLDVSGFLIFFPLPGTTWDMSPFAGERKTTQVVSPFLFLFFRGKVNNFFYFIACHVLSPLFQSKKGVVRLFPFKNFSAFFFFPFLFHSQNGPEPRI